MQLAVSLPVCGTMSQLPLNSMALSVNTHMTKNRTRLYVTLLLKHVFICDVDGRNVGYSIAN